MYAVSNEELRHQPPAHEGMHVNCTTCEWTHPLKAATSDTPGQDGFLMFYSCNGREFLGAVAGKLIPGLDPSTG